MLSQPAATAFVSQVAGGKSSPDTASGFSATLFERLDRMSNRPGNTLSPFEINRVY
jgi:hypothetical protein